MATSYEDFKKWADSRDSGAIWEIERTFGVDFRTATTWMLRYFEEIGMDIPMHLPETDEQWERAERVTRAAEQRMRGPLPPI